MNGEKVSQFIVQLIKLTRSKDIAWKSSKPLADELPNEEIVLDKEYQTEVNNRRFKLYKYQCKYYRDEYDYIWTERIRLILLDENGHTDYEFEYNSAMYDLYELVREQSSNVADVIDNILGLKLEIIEATYHTKKHSKDVTLKLKNMVNNNKLVIDANNDIDGDPDYGTPKKLKVKYSYAGETKEKEVLEGETLVLP